MNNNKNVCAKVDLQFFCATLNKMAKSKQNKKERKQQLRQAANPIGIQSVQQAQEQDEFEEEESEFNTKSTTLNGVPPLIKQLDSLGYADRESACMGLASLVLQDSDEGESDVEYAKKIEILLTNNAHKKLWEKLADPARSVRLAAAGALQNLVTSADSTNLERIVNDELHNVILVSMQAATETFFKTDVHPEEKKDMGELIRSYFSILAALWYVAKL